MSQESLHYKLLDLSDHIDSIASSLQNDIHQFLNDKIITIEELQQDLIQIETDFNHTLEELQILKEETLTFLRTILNEQSKKHNTTNWVNEILEEASESFQALPDWMKSKEVCYTESLTNKSNEHA